MKRFSLSLLTVVAVLCLFSTADAAKKKTTPAVDVVFVLDTTGSMGGLIEGAKLKIWSIANQIIIGTPAPELRVGLVGYRDRGDEYVTRVFDLSSDLDQVYGNLLLFQAGGGGDTPEHVSKGLSDAVHQMSWSEDKQTLRIVFLVGDAPPQTGYNDGFEYQAVCQAAVRKDIIINTIQCGDIEGTARYWREIAMLGEGEYAAIAQTGGMRSFPTPMDEELSRLSAELGSTVVAFGDEEMKARKNEADEMVASMPAAAVAERAAYKSVSGRMGAYDLLDALEAEEVKLEEIKRDHLPAEMRDMSDEEKRLFILQKKENREKLNRRIAELSAKRDVFIRDKLAEAGGTDSFDTQVLKMIRSQAGSRGLVY
jgi:hypothetical protein